jgi:hypothetical protein
MKLMPGDDPQQPQQEHAAASEPAKARGPETLPSGGIWHRGRKRFFGSTERAAITGIVVTLVIGVPSLILALSTGGSSGHQTTPGTGIIRATPPAAAPSSINSTQDLAAYVRSRPIWQSPPALLGSSLNLAFNPPMGNGPIGPTVLLPTDDGVVDAYSTSDLIAQGASMDGQSIVVVGRIENAVESPVDVGNWLNMNQPTDIELTGPNGRSPVFALADGATGMNGSVVYFPAVVAAVGQRRNGTSTSYLISLDVPMDASLYGTVVEGNTVPQVARTFKHHS